VLGALERLHGLGLLSDGRDLPLALFIWFEIAHAHGASNQMGDWHVHRSRNTASYRFSYLVFSSSVNRRGLITLAFKSNEALGREIWIFQAFVSH
jgi:hypothetical protein